MRLSYGLCALAIIGGAASAQVTTPTRPAGGATTSIVGAPSQAVDSLRLSRGEAITQALAHNQQIEVAREQVAEARARRVTAIAIPDPTLTAAFDQLQQPFALGSSPARPVGLALTIPFPDKFRLNSKIGYADIHANESNFKLQQQTVASQTSFAYDSLLDAFQHRTILHESRDLAADFLKRTQARFEAGTAAKLDQIQAQLGVAQADNALIGNEHDILAAEASLNRQLGRTTGAPIAATDSLTLPPPLPDSTSIVEVAFANRPELAMIQHQQEGASATTSLTKQFWLPDIDLAVQRDYAVPGAPLFTTGVSLPLPAFYWQHAKGDIAQSEHFERELAATYRDTRAQVTQDVRTAYVTAATSIKQAIFLRDQLVPAARDAYRIASTSYSLGGSSALEVLSARSALLDAESQYADALEAANVARADLNRALGIAISSPGTGAQ